MKKHLIFLLIFNAFLCNLIYAEDLYDIDIDRTYEKKVSREYKNLMKEYSKRHYDDKLYKLKKPKIIIIHSSASTSLGSVVSAFSSPRLIGREEITNGGGVNVGSHFIIDKDGTIYSFIPEKIMARHAVGFNHTSFGIENIGFNGGLTIAQIKSNVKLIIYLRMKYESIEHTVGHHEYNNYKMPHYKYVKVEDENYRPFNKIDPGDDFMFIIRAMLEKYGYKNTK